MTLEEFYKKNYPIVFGYLFSLCGDRTMAEDLASETFLRAMQKSRPMTVPASLPHGYVP